MGWLDSPLVDPNQYSWDMDSIDAVNTREPLGSSAPVIPTTQEPNWLNNPSVDSTQYSWDTDSKASTETVVPPQFQSQPAALQEQTGQYSWDTDPANPMSMREPIAPATTADLPVESPMEWGQVGQQALDNFAASAEKYATDIGTAVMNPLDTLGAVGDVVTGAIAKGIPGEQPGEAMADKIGKFYSDRYGSMEGFKKALAKDPVGILGDFATILTGGGTAVAQAPGIAGRMGKLAATAGKVIDPLSLPMKLTALTGKGIGHGAAELIGGLGTGTGAESLRQAAQAGFKGGETAKAFQSGIRDTANMQDVIGQAQGALQQMRSDRGAAYRSGMVDTTSDRTILDFSKIDDIITETKKMGTFEGKVKNPSTVDVVNKMASAVEDWGSGDPAKFHTPEGLDALKQRIGDAREGTDFASAERAAVNRVYNKIKDLIKDQAPTYAKTMKDYEEASTLIREIEEALSLKKQARADTALRKLQSVMRNNVSTNYGNRLALVQELERAGASTVLPTLAGQTLSSALPRGLGKLAGSATVGGGLTLNPSVLALLPFQSPRLMGEAAYYGGKGGRLASKLANIPGMGTAFAPGTRQGAMQSGRLQQLLEGEPSTPLTRYQQLLIGP